MCAAENINHKQLNSITYLLSRQTHNKTFLSSRPTNKYIREEVGVGGGGTKAHRTGDTLPPPQQTSGQKQHSDELN